jgi:hypothetical protein
MLGTADVSSQNATKEKHQRLLGLILGLRLNIVWINCSREKRLDIGKGDAREHRLWDIARWMEIG